MIPKLIPKIFTRYQEKVSHFSPFSTLGYVHTIPDRLTERPRKRYRIALLFTFDQLVRHDFCDDYDLERPDSKSDTFRMR